jgi:hypothetical protein
LLKIKIEFRRGDGGCEPYLTLPPRLRYFLKNFKKKDKKGTLPPSPPAGCSNLLILFNANDNDSYLLFTIFKKKFYKLGFLLRELCFSQKYKNSVLGMGPPTLTRTGPK